MNQGKVIYVAGPLSARNQQQMMRNRMAAIRYAYSRRALGEVVICPHEMGVFANDCLDERGWVDHGLALLSRSDECHIIGRWEHSNGTRDEINFGVERQIKSVFKPDWK